MNNDNSKIRTLSLTTVISDCEKETLLKRIQSKDGVMNCPIQGSNLSVEYDLMQTSLEELLLEIKLMSETSSIKLKGSFAIKLKTEFICFIETNQRENISNPSGWHLRLQNIYFSLAKHT